MKNIKMIWRWILVGGRYIFWGIFICFILVFLYFAFDKKGGCLEAGGVWDGIAKVCRSECLKVDNNGKCILR